MIEFDEIEGIEQERQAEAEEEHRKCREAAELAKIIELEAVVSERVQSKDLESNVGTPGSLIKIPVRDFEYLKKWKEVTEIFFLDAMNSSITKLNKLLADKARCAEVGAEAFEGTFDSFFAFVNMVARLRFYDGARAVCEALADAFQAERGCCAMVNQIMDRNTSDRRRGEARRCLHGLICKIADLSIGLCVHAYSEDPEMHKRLAELLSVLKLALIQGAVQPVCLEVWLFHGWETPLKDTLVAIFRHEETWEERSFYCGKHWKIRDVLVILGASLGSEDVQLLQAKEPDGELEDVDPDMQLEAATQPLVLRGVDPSCPGWRSIEMPDWPPEWATRWRISTKRICKTTPVTATRLLSELRSSFTSKKFQAQYRTLKQESRPGNKAHQEILSLTFNVQSEVLPRYGFEPTPKGLMEMRDEMPLFAGWDVWSYAPWTVEGCAGDEVVWKVRRDIHQVLDMGQVLPKMQLGGSESMGHHGWLRFAQLSAGVESGCAKASELISQADLFVLCCGAGLSADSGLAVYADVARFGAYASRNLDYSDICNQSWLRKEPEFFWGFWGQCYNDYRDTAPHDGYRIIRRWVERRFRSSAMADAVREQLLEDMDSERAKSIASTMPPPEKQLYTVKDHAGAFYAFTSNVDAHLWDVFQPCEIRECHGNTETYQCASLDGRCEGHWRAPLSYRFRVDKSSMLAPVGAPGEAIVDSDDGGDDAREANAPTHVGNVRGGGRPHVLRNMPEPTFLADAGFRTNHPKCPFCGAPARPAILMFKDSDFRDNRPQAARWEAWVAAAKAAAGRSPTPPRVVVLEIGAGGNVTTVRKTSESLTLGFLEVGAEAHLVRINPELPLGDGDRFAPGGDLEHVVVSILGKALECLRRIDSLMPEVLRREEPGS